MMNYFMILGRLTKDPKMEEIENKKHLTCKLAVPRSYKNAEGIYETDFLPVVMFDNIADNVNNYIKKGDLIAVKGHMREENGKLVLIAEKVSFLSSRKESEEE